MKRAILWFRSDLRLADHTAWHRVCAEVEEVIPVYILDPRTLQHPATGTRRVALLLKNLGCLDEGLRVLGGKLLFIQGDPVQELIKLAQSQHVEAIYWNQKPEPHARKDDDRLRQECNRLRIATFPWQDDMLAPPDSVLKKDGNPFLVFTPYSKAWRLVPKKEMLPEPKGIRFVKIKSSPIPSLRDLGIECDIELPPAGEKAARNALDGFVKDRLESYKSSRDYPAWDATSRLSHHLSFGTISVRTVYGKALEILKKRKSAQEEIDTFVQELIWRDFYRMILWHFPRVSTGAFKRGLDQIPWENNETYFKRWCEGKTGFPIVDAAMRQLNQTGWMHNRLRMIVASFLTKDLLIDWKWGEKYFMRQLFDADLAANNGGWQWSAGTGTDAQPYFRIFNPTSQAEKFDPEGHFIQKYVPEALSKSYPPPMVDHRLQRAKALLLYKK